MFQLKLGDIAVISIFLQLKGSKNLWDRICLLRRNFVRRSIFIQLGHATTWALYFYRSILNDSRVVIDISTCFMSSLMRDRSVLTWVVIRHQQSVSSWQISHILLQRKQNSSRDLKNPTLEGNAAFFLRHP